MLRFFASELEKEEKQQQEQRSRLWVVKKPYYVRGRRLEIMSSARAHALASEKRKGQSWLVEEYHTSPVLIHGRKFHLRLFVLLTSIDPLRLYIHAEGLAFFAAEAFVGADDGNEGTEGTGEEDDKEKDKEKEGLDAHHNHFAQISSASLNRGHANFLTRSDGTGTGAGPADGGMMAWPLHTAMSHVVREQEQERKQKQAEGDRDSGAGSSSDVGEAESKLWNEIKRVVRAGFLVHNEKVRQAFVRKLHRHDNEGGKGDRRPTFRARASERGKGRRRPTYRAILVSF